MKVMWNDASHGTGAWQLTSELPTTSPIVSYGWLAKDDPDLIVLAGTHYTNDGTDYWGATIAIPRGMVISMDELDA